MIRIQQLESGFVTQNLLGHTEAVWKAAEGGSRIYLGTMTEVAGSSLAPLQLSRACLETWKDAVKSSLKRERTGQVASSACPVCPDTIGAP